MPACIDCKTVSTRLPDRLDKGNFSRATSDCDTAMKQGLDAAKLASVWQSLPKHLGARGARDASTSTTVHGYTV
jgi:hypothetical protein